MSIKSVLISGNIRKVVSAFVLLLCSVFTFAQSPQLKRGATVYIEPMDGYETYLAAALAKKKVPLVVVTQKDKAEYIIKGNVSHNEPSHPDVVINNSASASINDNRGMTAMEASREQAQASMEASMERAQAAKAALGYSNASISIVDPKSTQIVFAYSAGKGGRNQFQKTAEDCAKHLKEFMEK